METEQSLASAADAPVTPRAPKKVLILIVTWNKKDYVLDLLNSLGQLDYPRDALDIVVVDNASTDGTPEAIAAAHPEVYLICNPENVGGTGGFNTGMRYALHELPEGSFDYLWLLDNDVLVHRQALNQLVQVLEENPDVAVAGSTMMQLDFPWRINEMGCFLNRGAGLLVLNRHFEEITGWQGRDMRELLNDDIDLTQLLPHCQPFMDVDYVAAASLVVRPEVARQIGPWRDYFIHFDDVEWCLRIGRAGWRVVVSAQSVIWHLSAAAKVPTWVLYYDNRNMLDTLEQHVGHGPTIFRAMRYTLKKGVYYALIGKADLGRLHREAVDDFLAGRMGAKNIKLDYPYRPNREIDSLFLDPKVKRVLIAFPINLQAAGIQANLLKAILQRPDLEVDFLREPDGNEVYQLPRQRFYGFPARRWRRWLAYWRDRNQYDVIIQSDYRILIGLSWLAREVVFLNDDGFSRRPRPRLRDVWEAALLYYSAPWKRAYTPKEQRLEKPRARGLAGESSKAELGAG